MLFLFLFPPIGWFFRQGSRRAARRWPSIFGFQPCAGFASRTPALPSVRHHWLPAVSSSYSSSLPRLLSSSRVGPVRAGPGLGPADPDAGRPPHGVPARPARGTWQLGGPAPTGVCRALPSCPAWGRRQAAWGRMHEAGGGSACGASYTCPSYGQPEDDACARVIFDSFR